jgi:DNA-binding NtrC family response regulator
VIITDQRMPGMTGVELLRRAKTLYPDTIRMVLSGYTELQSVTDAINEGAVYRFLTKPWDDEQLREQVRKAFEVRDLSEENRDLDAKIRTTNQELVAANRRLAELLQRERQRKESAGALLLESADPMGPLP